jgi:hypothetical protein
MPDVFTPNVVMHRPEGTLTNLYVIQPGFEAALPRIQLRQQSMR